MNQREGIIWQVLFRRYCFKNRIISMCFLNYYFQMQNFSVELWYMYIKKILFDMYFSDNCNYFPKMREILNRVLQHSLCLLLVENYFLKWLEVTSKPFGISLQKVCHALWGLLSSSIWQSQFPFEDSAKIQVVNIGVF